MIMSGIRHARSARTSGVNMSGACNSAADVMAKAAYTMPKNEGKARMIGRWLRLGVMVLLLALSLLVVLPAPTSRLWIVAIGATEWGYWLVPVGLLSLWGLRRRTRSDVIGLVIAPIAMMLLLLPVLQGFRIAGR